MRQAVHRQVSAPRPLALQRASAHHRALQDQGLAVAFLPQASARLERVLARPADRTEPPQATGRRRERAQAQEPPRQAQEPGPLLKPERELSEMP